MSLLRRSRRWVTGVTVLAVVAGLGVAVSLAHSAGALNSVICSGDCGARWLTPPSGIALRTPAADATSGVGKGVIEAAKLQAAVEPLLQSTELGKKVGFVALDGRDGKQLYRSAGGGAPLIPASTTKLLTSFAALRSIGPQHRFATTVSRSGDVLTLVGGGDPFLVVQRNSDSSAANHATLVDLANRTVAAVGKGASVTLHYDTSLFAGADVDSSWPGSYVGSNVVSRISPLWVDPPSTGLPRASDPARDAATRFAALLATRGIQVAGGPTPGRAAGRTVAKIESATVAQIVAQLLRSSDNEAAEVIARQTAIATGGEASFAGGAAAVEAVIEKAGIDTEGLVLKDGSGLSRDDRISAYTLAETVWKSTRSARTAAVADGLPVAGFSGTLAHRLGDEKAALGHVRAKTGTLTGVHSLAGIATLSGGRPVVYSIMTNGTESVSSVATVAAIDKVSAAVADCGCGA